MTSLRAFAHDCLGIHGGFSLLRDFFGHRHERPGDLSLRLQLSLLRNPHIHLDVILVGGDAFTSQQRREVDWAVFGARQIFEQIPLGIGRITFHQIDVAEADGLDILTSKGEVKTLLRRFRGSNDDALDVFFPRDYRSGTKTGYGNAPGCNKNLWAVNGCVVSTGPQVDHIRIQRLMAHEIGHALRLIHDDEDDKLMQSGGFGHRLSGYERQRMLRDCYVRKGC